MDDSSPPAPAQAHLPRSSGAAARLAVALRFAWRMFVLGFMLVILWSIWSLLGPGGSLQGELAEEHHSLVEGASNRIAIITLEGTILDGEGYTKQQIDQVKADPRVKAIVLRVNSPGGTVTASDYLYHHLRELVRQRDLPLVVSMGGIAASGGYYVSMAVGPVEETIFAEPTTWTGSIGVVIPHYSIAGLLEDLRIEEDSIKSHRLKQMGSPARPMTDEERRIFQALVDDSFDRFKEIVQSGRPELAKDPKALDGVATGQVFTTRQALANGLVDREGFVEDAIERALELARLDADRTEVIRYQRPGGLFDLGFIAHGEEKQSDLSALLDLTTPRAWYLCNWLARDPSAP